MKKQLFTLTRVGTFSTNTKSSNQCKASGHKDYSYEIAITCKNRLDGNKFLIDHVFVDASIQEAVVKIGMTSCEELCLIVTKGLEKLLKKNKVKATEIQLVIKPMGEDVKAYMTYKKRL
jgi:hypothetical protein